MDRICRRQIGARPFLRTAQYAIFHKWNSNSVGCGGGERGKRHGFNVEYIHGTATGNLFLLVHGNGEFSRIIISCLVRSFSLFERGSDRVGLCWRGKHRRWSRNSVDRPVDAELEIGRSNLGGDWLRSFRGVFDWLLQCSLHSFYGFHVGGGHCGLTLMILFWLAKKLFLIIIGKGIYLIFYKIYFINIIESKVAKLLGNVLWKLNCGCKMI